jgi:hypothetical protein
VVGWGLRSPAVIERFRVEARVLAELGHSAILPVTARNLLRRVGRQFMGGRHFGGW